MHWYHCSYYINACVICNIFSALQKLSFSRARDLSVQTARLPIDEYMVKKTNAKNFHSKILAVNQGECSFNYIFVTVLYLLLMASLSLFVYSLWHLIDFLQHRQLDRSSAGMVPPGEGLCCRTGGFPTTSCLSNTNLARGLIFNHVFYRIIFASTLITRGESIQYDKCLVN